MRNAIAIVAMLALGTGCGAAKSAISTLTGGKPNQVTVVTNVEPQPVVVNVQPAPVVIQQAEPKRSRFGSLKAMATGAAAGIVVGGVVGYAMNGSKGAGQGAAVGAGAGAVGGVVAHEATK